MEAARPSLRDHCCNMKVHWRQFAAVFGVCLLDLSLTCSTLSHEARIKDDENDWSRYSEVRILVIHVLEIVFYLLSSFLLYKLSRKTCVYVVCVCFIITGIIFECSNSVILDALSESLRVFGKVLTLMMTVIYASEIAHDDIRGTVLLTGPAMHGLYSSVFLSIMECCPFSFSWFVILPPAVAIVCFFFWLPETPIYLLRQDNKDVAEQSMMWLRGSTSPEGVAVEMERINEMLIRTRSDPSSTSSLFREFFSRRSLKYTGVVIMLHLTYSLSSALFGWNVDTKPPIQYDMWRSIQIPLQEFVGMLGIVIAIIICDRKGRKFTLFTSIIVCLVVLIPLGICARITEVSSFKVDGIFIIIFAIVNIFGNRIGHYIVLNVVAADIFPPRTLNMQLTFIAIVLVIFKYTCYAITHQSVLEFTFIASIFWFSVAMLVATGLFIFKFLPETKQQPTGFLLMESRDILLGNIKNSNSK